MHAVRIWLNLSAWILFNLRGCPNLAPIFTSLRLDFAPNLPLESRDLIGFSNFAALCWPAEFKLNLTN
jgi:hypothetical protein